MAVQGFGGPAEQQLLRAIAMKRSGHMRRRKGGPAGGRPVIPPELTRLGTGTAGGRPEVTAARRRRRSYRGYPGRISEDSVFLTGPGMGDLIKSLGSYRSGTL